MISPALSCPEKTIKEALHLFKLDAERSPCRVG
jgi:hypothetical protein